MRRFLLFVATATVFPALSACSSLQALEHGVQYQTAGSRSPTLVLESGMGDGLETWNPVYDSLFALTQSFRYSRAGYGRSPEKPDPRSSLPIVADLRTALSEADLSPPYILVGHSVGGVFVQAFARLHPEEVAGVVLVDPTVREVAAFNENADLPAILRVIAPKGMKQEWEARHLSMEELEALPPFPDIPLVVLSSGQSSTEDPEDFEQRIAGQRGIAEQSSQGEHIIVDGSGHYIHRDVPAVVIDAVRRMLERARVGT